MSADTCTFASTTARMLRSRDQSVVLGVPSVLLALHERLWFQLRQSPSLPLLRAPRSTEHSVRLPSQRRGAIAPKPPCGRCRLPRQFDATMRRPKQRAGSLDPGTKSQLGETPNPAARPMLEQPRCVRQRSSYRHRRCAVTHLELNFFRPIPLRRWRPRSCAQVRTLRQADAARRRIGGPPGSCRLASGLPCAPAQR